MSKTIQALVLRAFDDATTGNRFEKDGKPDLTEGEFANFEAAGLVRKADPTAPAPTKPAPRKRTRAVK
ncbi:hypothetical protein QCD71_12375 [Sphingomonas sp. PsM26]|nr:hypothetical protein [Sphingomonas sp. PsM26]